MNSRIHLLAGALILFCAALVSHSEAAAPKVDPASLFIYVQSDQPVKKATVWNSGTESWEALSRASEGLFTVSRDKDPLDADGQMRLRISPAPDAVYVLPAYRGGLPDSSAGWLRTHSLMYAEAPLASGETVRLSHRSHRVELTGEQNGRANLTFDGRKMLARPFQVRVRGEAAEWDSSAGVFRDPWGNPIRVEPVVRKDRVRFNVTYRVKNPRDTWSDVRLVFRPRSGIDRYERLRWEQFHLPRHNVDLRFGSDRGGRSAQVSVAMFPEAQWHHLAFTYTPEGTRVYVDGELATESGYFSGSIKNPGGPLAIGNSVGGNRPFHGVIDELFIADSALPRKKIRKLMEKGVAASDGSLAAAWSFDGKAADASGNGNHGELRGGTQFVDGKLGKGVSFDGKEGSMVRVKGDETLDMQKTLTVGAWLKWEKPIRFGRLLEKSGGEYACFIQEPRLPYVSRSPDEEFTTPLCDNPFVTVRGADKSYLGFLDHRQSNVFFRSTAEEASVEYWAWPREKGKTYTWTFELIPGYGPYENALLRALQPHTADYERKVHGNIGTRAACRRPKKAAEAGIRAVWYHGCWWHRNGKYFDPDQPLDAEYETVAGRTRTYRDRIEDIERCRKHGIDVYMYTQFAGISEPTVPEFESSMIRDLDGNLITVGHDGNYDNIWANPDLDLPYGQSFLKQVDGMLETFDCAGIAMDRVDRLDGRYGKLYDLAHFDGSATPYKHDGKHRPCSSIALQGKEFWRGIRRVLDRHDALWLANVPRAMAIFRLADGFIADIPHTPWNALFLRAMSNGKSFFVYDRGEYRRSTTLVARLIQSYALVSPGRESTLDIDREPTRLLYALPCGASYPRLWYFADGTTRMDYNPHAEGGLYPRYRESTTTRGTQEQ